MNVDVVGRVNNLSLPKTKGLLPVHEAVINSIHACSGIKDGYVRIIINRDTTQQIMDDERILNPIIGFTVIDNGNGFTEENFSSFITSDSTSKANLGGKGIGRFLWLKAFESVSISSRFLKDGRLWQRSFDFILTETAIEDHKIEESSILNKETVINLRNLKTKYQQYMPKKTSIIAQKILEHNLSLFILGDIPKIFVVDPLDNEEISLCDIYNEYVRDNIETRELNVRNKLFKLDIIKYPTTSETTHRVFYCAHSREVKSEDLSDTIPLLSRRIQNGGDGHEFIIIAYVSGEYFDATVNQERTAFTYDSDNDTQTELEFEEAVPFREIRLSVTSEIKSFTEPYIETIRKEHRERISEFVKTKNPEYRHVVKYRLAEIDEIPPESSEEKLELSLHKIGQQIEREVKENSLKLMKINTSDIDDIEEYKNRYYDIIDKITEIGQSNLSRYIVHRKMILNLLENRLSLQEDGRYSLEESIHEIIFPLKTTSDETEYIKQNLWIIDEKLSYHFFLASDKPLSTIDTVSPDSIKKPDIIIFNHPLAFTEDDPPYSSIVIIEFKRPLRDDYTNDENPIAQVIRYVKDIRSKKAKDKRGRIINVDSKTPFYAYIMCDITPKLEEIATERGFFSMPDSGGYYWFNQNYKIYIEIISFDKLLSDAKKRNRVLFDRLGLPHDI